MFGSFLGWVIRATSGDTEYVTQSGVCMCVFVRRVMRHLLARSGKEWLTPWQRREA